ncbi:MAG: marine proteobacterial sortase target protein [Pseudomonadota bacterium]
MRSARTPSSAEGVAAALAFLSALIAAVWAMAALSDVKAQEATAAPTTLASASDRAGLIRPSDLGAGGLLLQSVHDGLYVEAPTLATDVEIDVAGPIVRAKVTQRFQNASDQWVEGVYVFPLPEDAAVDTLKMVIGERVIEGQVKERQEARRIYEQARREGFRASLIEQERANVFTNSVANIGPGETIVVQIEYQDAARYDNGAFSLRFPMVVAPRYTPAPDIVQMVDLDGSGFGVSDPVPDRDRIAPPVVRPDETGEAPLFSPLTLSVNLEAGFDLDAVESSHHAVDLKKRGDRATVSLKDGAVEANKDFELVWRAKAGAEPAAALFSETVGGERYVLAMITPPTAEQALTARPREAIFVIDNSGSMSGPSIKQAKASLLMALNRLAAQDTFNVIRFDDSMDMAFPSAVPVTEANIARAKRFVSALQAEGGTEMLPALQAALVDATPADQSRLRQVVFLTDGAIGNEAQMFAEIGANLGRSRLFTVGIGSAPNSYFMTRAARLGRGTFTHIGSEDQVGPRMGELFEKLERPVLTNIVASFPREALAEAWPDPLPDLYAGEPVVLAAKVKALRGKLRIAGDIGGQSWLAELDLKKAAEGDGVSKLWARRKIAAIEESRFDGAEPDRIDAQVLAVALGHDLVSRLTSLVAVDVTPARPDGEPVERRDVPVNLPEGWDFDKVFGPEMNAAPIRQREAFAPQAAPGTLTTALAMRAQPAADAAATSPTAGLALPQGSLGFGQLLLIGLALWLLSLALLTLRLRLTGNDGD